MKKDNFKQIFKSLILTYKNLRRIVAKLQSTTLQFTVSFLKLFKILSYEIFLAKFEFGTQISAYVASGRNVNFMAMLSLKTYTGLDREDDSGYKVSLRTIFDGQIPHKSLNFILSSNQCHNSQQCKYV